MSPITHLRIAALLIAVGIASAGWFVSQGLERLRMADRSVVIKGLAEQDVQSDYATWSLTFRRAAGNFMEVQKALAADREKVLSFLSDAGFTAEEIEVRPLLVRDAFSAEYANANQPFRYTGTGLVLVSTTRIDRVESAALATDPLTSQGWDDGTSRSKRLRVVSTFEYELR